MDQPRVCVIGAGAGGLSAAFHLAQRGYRHVTVYESADRVGGLCHSFTADNLGFDLGGNYVLPNFTAIRELADAVGAPLTGSPDRVTWDHTLNGGQGGLRSTLASVLVGTNLFAFGWAVLKYVWQLLRFHSVMSPEGFARVSGQPELCQPFSAFLKAHGLDPLRRLFVIPITLMGYAGPGEPGKEHPSDPEYFDTIATAYVLKYVDLRTLWVLLLAGTGLSKTWPKRFADGYQRLWERVAWNLDVRLSTQVLSITRGDKVTVRSRRNDVETTEVYDKLVLACPAQATLRFLDATDLERNLLQRFKQRLYFVQMARTRGMPDHIVDVIPPTAFGRAWAWVKQWPGSDICVYYAPVSDQVSDEHVRQAITEDVRRIGAEVLEFRESQRWPYFPHLEPEDLAAGTYDLLEGLQGERHTLWLGNTLAYELAARSAAYAKARVQQFFPPVQG